MHTLNFRGKLVVLKSPMVMGIINVTPDSFFRQSRQMGLEAIVARAGQMLAEGADILDIGGQSTRPGADEVGAEAELERVLPAIDAIAAHYPEALISVDTFQAKVAQAAVAAGACMVNDVSGGLADDHMLETVGRLHVPYVCMHMRGTPKTMQSQTDYQDVLQEVMDYFIQRLETCRAAGIHDVIIDPGFGFAKTIQQNFDLLRRLEVFDILNVPLLAGISRKSTIYKTLGVSPEEALNGTTVLHTVALLKGAAILRVHDVKEAVEAVKLVGALNADA
jgi:dihydropteroate synthase